MKYFAYIPAIICKISNWPAFMLNYLGFTNTGGTYYFRNGTEICDREGTLTGIIAVVFIRKNYGDIRNETVIVDIGANIGVFSIYAATHAKNATVYAFEPVLANYELLIQNISKNDLNNRIRAFNLGCASESGKRNIYLSSCTLHSLVDEQNQRGFESIDCISLEDIIKVNGLSKIDLLKINCEGAEYEILYSIGRDCFDKISDIRLEYHNIDEDRNNANYLRAFLENMGYQTVKLWENSQEDGFLWMCR